MSEQTINTLPYLGLALVLGSMGIAFVWHVSVLGIHNSQREAELKSQERIRAIECGYPVDEAKPVNAGITIATAVPCTAFGCAVPRDVLRRLLGHHLAGDGHGGGRGRDLRDDPGLQVGGNDAQVERQPQAHAQSRRLRDGGSSSRVRVAGPVIPPRHP